MEQYFFFSIPHSQRHVDKLHEEIKSACNLKSDINILLVIMASIYQALYMCVLVEVLMLAAETHDLQISVD